MSGHLERPSDICCLKVAVFYYLSQIAKALVYKEGYHTYVTYVIYLTYVQTNTSYFR